MHFGTLAYTIQLHMQIRLQPSPTHAESLVTAHPRFPILSRRTQPFRRLLSRRIILEEIMVRTRRVRNLPRNNKMSLLRTPSTTAMERIARRTVDRQGEQVLRLCEVCH
jgi:aspartate aminotransferase-like enzyme